MELRKRLEARWRMGIGMANLRAMFGESDSWLESYSYSTREEVCTQVRNRVELESDSAAVKTAMVRRRGEDRED